MFLRMLVTRDALFRGMAMSVTLAKVSTGHMGQYV